MAKLLWEKGGGKNTINKSCYIQQIYQEHMELYNIKPTKYKQDVGIWHNYHDQEVWHTTKLPRIIGVTHGRYPKHAVRYIAKFDHEQEVS